MGLCVYMAFVGCMSGTGVGHTCRNSRLQEECKNGTPSVSSPEIVPTGSCPYGKCFKMSKPLSHMVWVLFQLLLLHWVLG